MNWVPWTIVATIILVPVLIGILAHSHRHSTPSAFLVGLVGGSSLILYGIHYRGIVATTPDKIIGALLLIMIAAATSGTIGWFSSRLTSLFRTEEPQVALRKTGWLFLSVAFRVLVFVIVAGAFALIVMLDLSQSPPTVMHYYWQTYQSIHVVIALLIVLVWSIRYSRAPNVGPISTPRLVLCRVVPYAVFTLLLLPIVMAWVEVSLSTPLIECPPLINESQYVLTNMIDYTIFILRNVAKGVAIDIGFYFPESSCIPHRDSLLGSALSFVLNLAPGITVAWLALRSYRLRTQLVRTQNDGLNPTS